ncbi:MAG TPA: uroporphyrinogen decarboxylase family protein [Solirubrobacteraceae bacterium]|jgi:5-methyltetrahydropteroyltriglutamate--homocysteine methyltransferase|nr:uroporphyrinogen decarboxylase family protein [Solirubrobacteraceae bacterium]
MAPKKIVSTVLPTTMVGSYPRPHWYHDQLDGRDVRVAFKNTDHAEAYEDATIVAIRDQEEAGLDIITDGQMSYDDYVGVIGSFCWYMYERIGGFDPAKEPHPSEIGAAVRTKEVELLADWGGVINSGPVTPGPLRLTDLYKVAAKHATKPLKVSVGAGPINLAWHVHFQHYKDAKELSYALAPIFNAEMKELVAAGADYLQIEDLGAWLPLFTDNEEDYKWIGDVIAQCVDGVDARIGWHFCFGNAWGNALSGIFPTGYRTVLPYFYDTPIDEFVLDFANRDMEDIDLLSSLPEDKSVAVGVLDIRTMMVESPEKVAERIRKVIEVVPPERVILTTDCGMKPLPRLVAKMKLKALVEGAAIVRSELK